jgi:hypothetical protein
VIKYRILRWAGLVAHMGEKRNAYSILVGKPERNYLENLDDDRMMIFNCFYM